MKPLGKTKDGVMDNLLRAYVSRPGNPSQTCPEFDPDLANAYIEHSLPSGARSGYERHLSECGACRKNVVALAKMSDTPAFVSGVRDRVTWLSGVRRVLGVMSRPQWAMATAAVLVLAISLPVLLSRDVLQQRNQAPGSTATDQSPVASPEGGKQADQEGFAASAKSAPNESSPSTAAALKRRESETGAAGTEAGTRAAGAPGTVAGAIDNIQRDQKNSTSAAEDTQRKSLNEQAAQTQPQAAGSVSQVAKSDSEETRSKQSKEKDANKPVPEPKPGRVDEPRDKENLAKAEAVAPPPAPASPDADRSRSGLKRPQKLALTDSAGSGESVRSNLRRINKKDFYFRDNTWIDKDYEPNSDLAVVTIIRDSNVYKELLAKRAGLRPYLESFGENQRAIIVFKGTVYKLIPQK